MDQKITRRVVLGTTITGLVAGPFVIRALKQEKPLEPSESVFPVSYARKQLFQEWKDVYQTLSVKKEPVDSPKIVSVKHDFSKPRHWKFRALETFYTGVFDSPETAQSENMVNYTLMEGTIKVEGGEQGVLHVSVDKHERNQLEIDFEASRKNGVKIVEKQVENPDGTMSTQTIIPTGGFNYDPVKKRYVTDVVEKKTVYPLPAGQFVLEQTLVPNFDYLKDSSVPRDIATLKSVLGLFYFSPLIRFPLPKAPMEIKKTIECSAIDQDLECSKFPIYQVSYQGMVRCGDFTTIKIIP
ncbi:MAG: hypothetical protein LBJ67_01970, partial [Planctomycetaceae bacterium]|nr:hypothetical protein [Planctomycetaceae bacterium]